MVSVHTVVTVLAVTSVTHTPGHTAGSKVLRVYQGTDDTLVKYPYVVSIQPSRKCTGSLITKNWVLTAAHCCKKNVKRIQYGNMSIPSNMTTSKSSVLKVIRYTSKRILAAHDIGLLLVNSVLMDYYGSVSAVDYSTLLGHAVEYAGFGITFFPRPKTGKKKMMQQILVDRRRPLQIAQAVVTPCAFRFKGRICVSPKCDTVQLSLPGDSGGPLFFDNKIVGVVSGAARDGYQSTDRFFAAISPCLSWINSVLSVHNLSDPNAIV